MNTHTVPSRVAGLIAIAIAAIAAGALMTGISEKLKAAETAPEKIAATQEKPAKETLANGCTVERFSVQAKAMDRQVKVSVLLPPAYAKDASARFPVIYALHGLGAPFDSWIEMRPLQQAIGERPTIIVCFDGDKAGWYVDAVKGPTKFNAFFFDDLIPHIDGTYRTRADGKSRGVTGFSMGGYGALHYAFTHPDRIGSVSALSAVYDILGERGGKQYESFVPLMGAFKENRANYVSVDVYHQLENLLASKTPVPPMYLHCGTEDSLIEDSRTFETFLKEQNKRLGVKGTTAPLTFVYQESSGAHNWPFWRDASVGVVEFHWRTFNAPPATRPATAPKKP